MDRWQEVGVVRRNKFILPVIVHKYLHKNIYSITQAKLILL